MHFTPNGAVDANGGRVLGVNALGPDLTAARANAYSAVDELSHRVGSGVALTRYSSDVAKLS